jgi:hypothetical protein
MCNLLLTILAASLTLSGADPLLGTWKMNTAKSEWSPGPTPTDGTLVLTREGEWYVRKLDRVDSEGKLRTTVNRHTIDGKEHPWGAGRLAVNKIDDYRYEWVFRGEGTYRAKGRTVISQDGKTLTETYNGADGKGQKENRVTAYDRQ